MKLKMTPPGIRRSAVVGPVDLDWRVVQRVTHQRQRHRFWATITMSSPNLPPELLDHVVDFLQDAADTLESCCLVSKSWIPRTRKHLFEFVEFYTEEDVESWKTTFQDPSMSPACYTKTLFVRWPWATPVAETKELGDWIRTFSRVVHLKIYLIDMDTDEPTDSLVPFHRFSPEIRSLCLLDIHSPLPPVFDFIHSFPLLEDLSVSTPVIPAINTNDGVDGQPTAVQYLSPPTFTGTLDLCGVDLIATQLLSLPNSLHFRKLHLTWNNEADISTTALLVESCCSTLESLHVNPGSLGTSSLPLHESYKWSTSVGESFLGPINLSKATKLKYITLTLRGLNPQWVITTLRTATPSHRDFRQI